LKPLKATKYSVMEYSLEYYLIQDTSKTTANNNMMLYFYINLMLNLMLTSSCYCSDVVRPSSRTNKCSPFWQQWTRLSQRLL